jgi:hypothetical protein
MSDQPTAVYIDVTNPLGPAVPVLNTTACAPVVVDAPTFEQDAVQKPPPRYPSLGRIVQVLVDPSINNGADVAPAVVTRVFSVAQDRSTVNLRVFLDSGTNQGAEWATSRYLWPDEDTARSQQEGTPVGSVSVNAFWPALGEKAAGQPVEVPSPSGA